MGGIDYTKVDVYLQDAGRASGCMDTFLVPIDEDKEIMINVGSGILDCFPPRIIHTLSSRYADEPLSLIGCSFNKFCKLNEYHIGTEQIVTHKYAGDDETEEKLCSNESMRLFSIDMQTWIDKGLESGEFPFKARQQSMEEARQRRKQRMAERQK